MTRSLDILYRYASHLELPISQSAACLFEIYLRLVLEWNTKLNLSGARDAETLLVEHLCDSLTILAYVPIAQSARVIDVGSGAGFPGIPVWIARPDLHVTLLEARRRRVAFLEHAVSRINSPCRVVHGRAEVIGHSGEFRECFDVALERAVAPIMVSAELCVPMVAVGGTCAMLKGPRAVEEMEEAKQGVERLGARCRAAHMYTLPGRDASRTVIVLAKTSHTPPEFPGPRAPKEPQRPRRSVSENP